MVCRSSQSRIARVGGFCYVSTSTGAKTGAAIDEPFSDQEKDLRSPNPILRRIANGYRY
jgi:hypothetical protein